MPKYMVTGSYSLDGIKEIVGEGGSTRVAQAGQLFKAVGGSVEAMYFAFGSDDLVVIVDAPDTMTMAALSLLVAHMGALRPKVTALITAEELDGAAQMARTITK